MRKFKVKFVEMKSGLEVEKEIEVEASCVEKAREYVKKNYHVKFLTPIVVSPIVPLKLFKEDHVPKPVKNKIKKKKVKKENVIDKESKEYKKYIKRVGLK